MTHPAGYDDVRKPQDEPCCIGVPSGYITPEGGEARMCDDDCGCWSCVLSRDFDT